MSSLQHDLVRSLLRPSENLQCLLNVELPAVNTRTRVPPNILPVPTDPTDTPFRQHLIAVITHRNYTQDTEVGSLFVLNASVTNDDLRVVDALPITEYLALTVAQTGPLVSQTTESDPGVPTESWSAWLLTIRRDAQDASPLAFTVRTRNTPKLQSFTAECRRLKEIATAIHPVDADFTWVETYASDPSSRRLDLRLRKQPLHTRLSPAIAGLPGDDVSDVSIIRRDWIEHAAAKEASSGNVKHLRCVIIPERFRPRSPLCRIRLGTFNVNGKAPSQDLYPWLRSAESKSQAKAGWISPLKLSPFEISSDPLHRELHENNSLTVTTDMQQFGDPDMLVLGFQELDLSAEALLYTTSTLKEDEWLTAIFAGLGEKRVLYEKLISRQLVGMLLVVIVKKALVPCFTDVRSCDAGSGIMRFMGNKGATAIRLEFTPKISSDPQITTYRSTILTFVNAHLAASDEMTERRNYDFQELSGRLAFSPNGLNGVYQPASFARDTCNIYQSDVLFWMVHLNYRLDLPDGDVRELLFLHALGIDSIQTLLLYDQLRAAIRSNKAFSGFTEHPITHIPTYRLALGVSKDRLGYDMKRKPAWTDRILYMAPPDVRVAQLAYRSHPETVMSDHQPVSADFDISLALIDQSQYENVLSALHRELAGFESSERRPKIKIEPISIDFGTVKYKQAIDREVVIQNEGDIPCAFRFVGTGAGSGPICEHLLDASRLVSLRIDYINYAILAPSWLRIEPIAGLLRPRETTNILLSAYVDNDSAAKLNLGSSIIECTLIIHTALGKDDFLAVSGSYQYTCFANTLERLTRLDGPIRRLKSPEEATPAGQAISAPREIMRLINWMMVHGSATVRCFVLFFLAIVECLDTGDEFPSESPDGDHRALIAAFASTLVSFLDSLIEPVVPARLHAHCLQARDKDEAFEVLSAFPHESINVWISLTAFLHYFARQCISEDKSNPTVLRRAQRLASIFAPVLLRDDPTGVHPRASPVGKRDFLLHFID
ncbi:DNase I-like protein [Lanmaoa asiatica]|nr:DNase I-like protein [Lanmaoa asiatica]